MKPNAPAAVKRPAASRLAWTASLVIAAGGGWGAHGLAGPATPDEALAAVAAHADGRLAPARKAAPQAMDTEPLIAVAPDGRVTLRVEQQPLEWVLEQIGRQAGWPELATRGATRATAHGPAAGSREASAADAPPAACPPAWGPADAARLVQAIDHGPEPDRVQALFRARAEGVPLPDTLLRTLVETAPSDELRLVALDVWLERQPADARGQRAALERALLVPHPAVQHEARQRLDDLLEIERLDAQAARDSP